METGAITRKKEALLRPDIETAYRLARDAYAGLGVDADAALKRLKGKRISLPCWQGDDVRGFEAPEASWSGAGIQVTGSYPGRARSAAELRQDMAKAFSLIPGKHRANLHAIYGEFGKERVDRDRIETRHFSGWVQWAKENDLGLDFNATLFAHPRAASGFTLSSRDPGIRRFWVDHVNRCRAIGADLGRELASLCLHNLWIPDGMKDACVDRGGYRSLLKQSLDEIFAAPCDPHHLKDSLESKLFGIGSESFVVGSHEFYIGYALSRPVMLCLDLGHFHPTESVADKLSSLLSFAPEILLHISRGVRWDSDHVVVLDDSLREVALEIVRLGAWERVHLALDFFDASLNRVGAWVAGARATLKALLYALLEPTSKLVEMESAGDYFGRLALLEELKTMPFGAVWDYYCLMSEVPPGREWITEVSRYENEVLRQRG
jgi:L-rhamnose isomerase